MDLSWRSNLSPFKYTKLVITFLLRNRHLFISWLKLPFAVILEPLKIKSATVLTVFPSICHEVTGPDAMIFVFWMLSFKPTWSCSVELSLYIWKFWFVNILLKIFPCIFMRVIGLSFSFLIISLISVLANLKLLQNCTRLTC